MGAASISSSWTVCDGCLTDSIAVDSSTSPINQLPCPKSPLVLRPPSPDSSLPCDITISFSQRHEVQQVYIRSTARVYEIYYAPKQDSSNEYLCTVRCGLAMQGDVEEKRSREEINLAAAEDDWVNIKVPCPSSVPAASSPPSLMSAANKDFYEATAQIADAEPCVSITIRLVSIQSGDHVYVDEFYVSAEPLDPASDIEDNRSERTTGTSLMAMLVPTLLQLSRTRVANQVQGVQAGDRKNGPGFPAGASDGTRRDLYPKASALANASQPQAADVCPMESVTPYSTQTSPCEPVADKNPDAPCSCSENALKDLISRVSRIEQICLRFEENMLRPISSIEARLGQVEAQLKALNLSSTDPRPGGHGYNKFSAPDCSFTESSFNTLPNSNCGELQSDEVSLSKSSVVLDGASDSVSAASCLPGASALPADSSDGEDEQEADAPRQDDEIPKEKTKRALSVDDALATALAGFVSSISGCSVKYTQCLAVKDPDFLPEDDERYQCLAVKAPDFLPEDDECHQEETSVTSQCNDVVDSSNQWTDKSDCTKDLHISAPSPSDDGGDGDSPCEKQCVKVAGEERDNLQGTLLQVSVDDYWRIEEPEHWKGIAEESSVLPRDNAEPLEESHHTQLMGSPCLGEEVNPPGAKVQHDKDEIRAAKDDVLDGVLVFSHDACAVDFETPILDVKFISEESSSTNCALEALWGTMPETNGDLTDKGAGNDSLAHEEQEELIVLVDNSETVTCSTNSVDHQYRGLLELPVNEDVQDSFPPGSNDILSDSLI